MSKTFLAVAGRGGCGCPDGQPVGVVRFLAPGFPRGFGIGGRTVWNRPHAKRCKGDLRLGTCHQKLISRHKIACIP